MTTEQIAQHPVEFCRRGEFETAQTELFAEDAASIEPMDSEDFEKETHGGSLSELLVAGNSFAIIMNMDITMKEKERMNEYVGTLCR